MILMRHRGIRNEPQHGQTGKFHHKLSVLIVRILTDGFISSAVFSLKKRRGELDEGLS